MSSEKKQLLIFILLLILIAALGFEIFQNIQRNKQVLGEKIEKYIPPSQTKTENCIVNGALPDPDCTPGAIFVSATKEQICTPGYSKKVRNVPEKTKDEVYAMYGIKSHSKGQYEVDHYISLELGGSNDISNLWPEAAEPFPGFHQKDKVENYLHAQLCSGKITLGQAQKAVSIDWLTVYNNLEPQDPLLKFIKSIKIVIH